MPIVVQVMAEADYNSWIADKQKAAAAVAELANQEWSLEQLVAQGQTVYTTYCMACHQQNGQGLPPAFPSLLGSPIATGPIGDHVAIVINGRPGTAMSAYGALLSPVDIAAVVTYERNAFGNTMGDMITPVEILQLQAAGE